MTEAQKLANDLKLKLSEQRGRMAVLGKLDEPSEDEKTELRSLEDGTDDLERRWRVAAKAVEAEEDSQVVETKDVTPEDRELREIRDKVSFAEDYVGAALEQRAVDGAAAEFNKALGIAGNRFPLEMLAPVEERAKTDADTVVRSPRWVDRLFSMTAAMHVGVTFDNPTPGASSYPITTAGASAAQRGRTEAAADAAWTIGSTELKPTRNTVRAVFSDEDAIRNPGLEDALIRDLRMALTEGIDRAIFLGDAGANENTADIVGLQTAANVIEKTITQANKIKGDKTVEKLAELVDGKHAANIEDLRVAASVGANTLWTSTVFNAVADTRTLAEFLKGAGLSWMTRGDIDAATTNGKFGAFIGRGRGIEGAGIAAVWRDAQLIRDPYSNAAKGEVALTISHLWAFGLPRPSNFARLKFVA